MTRGLCAPLRMLATALIAAMPLLAAAGTAPVPTPTDAPTTGTPVATPTATEVPTTPTLTPSPTVSPSPSPSASPSPSPTPVAIVRSTLLNPPSPIRNGSRLTIPIRVAENPTGLTPIQASIELQFDGRLIRYFGIQGGQLGTTIAGPMQGTAPNNYILVSTFSNPSNRVITPSICTIGFDVIATESTTLNIRVADARNSSGPLLGPTSDTRIPHIYDNSGLTGISIIVPTPTPTPSPTPSPSPSPTPSLGDHDGDGLTNDDEAARGTNIFNRDSDGDRVEDGVEVALGTDPLNGGEPPSGTDSDNDTLPDAQDSSPNNPDRDGDRYLDGYEVAQGTDPDDPASHPALGDANGDRQAEFTDGVIVFNIFLGNFAAGDYGTPQLQDVNRDGNVDFTDGVIIFNFFLGNYRHLPLL